MGELIDQDQEHLRLLKIGFYILACMTGAVSMFSLLYVGLGGFIASGIFHMNDGRNPDPRFIGWIFLAIGGLFLLIGATVTFLAWYTGRSLEERKRWTFCVVVSALCCLQMPFGTAIGVCGLIVLNRPSVKALFTPATSLSPPPLPPLGGR